jgi:hypothetical protein
MPSGNVASVRKSRIYTVPESGFEPEIS